MDFKRLGYFAQVAELGSLSKASDRVRITQPSLSRQMRLLEEELGATLFVRGARGMHLTEAGEMLYARIAGPMREIGHAIYEVRSLPTEAGGHVVVGMPPTIVQMLAGGMARRVATHAPKVSLRIIDANSAHLLERMQSGELDIGILYGPTPSGLNASRLLEDELMLVAPPQSQVAREATIEFRRLADLPLILPGAVHGLTQLIESSAAKARIKLNIAVEADSHQLMKELVEAGLGYAILPHCAFAREAAMGRLAFMRITKPGLMRQLFLALKPEGEAAKASLQVESFIRQEVGALIQQGTWSAARACGIGES